MKKLRFTRSKDNVLVDYSSTLRDIDDVNENFQISRPTNINNYLETKLFYHFDQKKWTLNEMVFFANNNNLCLTILEEDVVIKQYGICEGCLGSFQINNECFIVNGDFLSIN